MTDPDTPETTTGGALGKVVGKLKEAAGKVTGRDDLAREGRLQQAQADAEAIAERQTAETEQLRAEQQVEAAKQENELERRRLHTEIAAAEREKALEHDRELFEREAAARAEQQAISIEQDRQAQERAAAATAKQAVANRAAEEGDVARLEREAHLAEATADAVDPEVN